MKLKPLPTLSVITLLLFSLFVYLGLWQLGRMEEKKAIEDKRLTQASLSTLSCNTDTALHMEQHVNDLQFRKVEVTGEFLNELTVFLDNQTVQGMVGYKVYSLFSITSDKEKTLTEKDAQQRSDHNKKLILIDRGFIPNPSRQSLPQLPKTKGQIRLSGSLLPPPSPGFTLFNSTIKEKHEFLAQHQLRIQALDPPTLMQVLNLNPKPYIYNFVIQLPINSPYAFTPLTPLHASKTAYLSSSRHLGYAVQWFTMAAVVLIYCAILLRRYRQSSKTPVHV